MQSEKLIAVLNFFNEGQAMHHLLPVLIAIVFVAGCGKSPETTDTENPSSPNSSITANNKASQQAKDKNTALDGSASERQSFKSLESILGNEPIPTDQAKSNSYRPSEVIERG